MPLTPAPSVASSHPGPAFRGALVAADRALVFFGMILLLGIVKYLISGNSEAEDFTGAGDPLARASMMDVLNLRASLLVALNRSADALRDLERYTMGYVDSYLHDGRELLKQARLRRQSLQSQRRELAG